MFFTLTIRIIDSLPLIFQFAKFFSEPIELRDIVQSAHFIPRFGWQPFGGVFVRVVQTDTAREEKSEIVHVDLVAVHQKIATQNK